MEYKIFSELSNEVCEPISYYAKNFDQDFKMEMHAHTYFEVMYCNTGRFVFEVKSRADNEIKKLELMPNEFVFIDAGVFHQIYVHKGELANISNLELVPRNKAEYNPSGVNDAVEFNFQALRRQCYGLKEIADNANGYAIGIDSENVGISIKQFLEHITYNHNSFEENFLNKLNLYRIFIEIGKCISGSAGKSVGIVYVKKALELIKKKFYMNLTLDEIAQYAGVNKAYLQRLFKMYTHRSVTNSLNQYRVEKCKSLLEGSNSSVSAIGELTGFSNRQHMIYEFKLFTGMTPTEYRTSYLSRYIDHHFEQHDSMIFNKESSEIDFRNMDKKK